MDLYFICAFEIALNSVSFMLHFNDGSTDTFKLLNYFALSGKGIQKPKV